jgi:hypothetical protein
MADVILYPGNDFEVEVAITRRNASTGASEAADGLEDLEAWLSLTHGGAAIHADLTKTLTERASTPGLYYAVIEGSEITTHLAPLGPLVVYRVIADDGNIKLSTKLTVALVRPL